MKRWNREDMDGKDVRVNCLTYVSATCSRAAAVATAAAAAAAVVGPRPLRAAHTPRVPPSPTNIDEVGPMSTKLRITTRSIPTKGQLPVPTHTKSHQRLVICARKGHLVLIIPIVVFQTLKMEFGEISHCHNETVKCSE